MRRVGGDEVADPPEETPAADPEAGRDDEPEGAAQEIAVINLSDPGNDEAEHGGHARMARVRECDQQGSLRVTGACREYNRHLAARGIPVGIETDSWNLIRLEPAEGARRGPASWLLHD